MPPTEIERAQGEFRLATGNGLKGLNRELYTPRDLDPARRFGNRDTAGESRRKIVGGARRTSGCHYAVCYWLWPFLTDHPGRGHSWSALLRDY
jgi:hypothetical protein